MAIVNCFSFLVFIAVTATLVDAVSTYSLSDSQRKPSRRQTTSVPDQMQASNCRNIWSNPWCDRDSQCKWTGYICAPKAAIETSEEQWLNICNQYDESEWCESMDMGGEYFCKWYGTSGKLQGCQPDVNNEDVAALCAEFPFRTMCRNVPYCRFISQSTTCRPRTRSELTGRFLSFDG